MSAADWSGRHRFFVEPKTLDRVEVVFDRAQSHQLARVLRARPGEMIVALDGSGAEYLVRLTDRDGRSVRGEILERRDGLGEPRLPLTLCQALLPREALELSLQKGTESGISRFRPVVTQRVVARASAADWGGRHDRLIRIAREAAEQSERARVPLVESPIPLPEALARAADEGPVLAAWERGVSEPLRPCLRRVLDGDPPHITLLIGPEGGFTPEELELMRRHSAHLVWLGRRILRAETAGAILASVVLYEAGEMGEAE